MPNQFNIVPLCVTLYHLRVPRMSLCDGSRIQATDSRPLKYNEVYALSCLHCSVECSSRNSLKIPAKRTLWPRHPRPFCRDHPDGKSWLSLDYFDILWGPDGPAAEGFQVDLSKHGAYLKIQWYPMFRQTDKPPKFTVFLLLGSSCTSFDGFRMVDVATQYALTGSNSAPLFGGKLSMASWGAN